MNYNIDYISIIKIIFSVFLKDEINIDKDTFLKLMNFIIYQNYLFIETPP